LATALLCAALVALSRRLAPTLSAPAARLAGLVDAVPRLLAASLGLGLVGVALLGAAWTPAVAAGDVALGDALVVAQALVGAWLLFDVGRASRCSC